MNTTTVPVPASATAMETARLARREHATFTPGDRALQGDLIMICLAKLPASARPRDDRQMADGDTRGSKHVVVGGEVFDADADEVIRMVREATSGEVLIDHERYVGPVFTGPCVLEHPEHQHQAFPTDTVAAVIYQRNQDADEREMRARD